MHRVAPLVLLLATFVVSGGSASDGCTRILVDCQPEGGGGLPGAGPPAPFEAENQAAQASSRAQGAANEARRTASGTQDSGNEQAARDDADSNPETLGQSRPLRSPGHDFRMRLIS